MKHKSSLKNTVFWFGGLRKTVGLTFVQSSSLYYSLCRQHVLQVSTEVTPSFQVHSKVGFVILDIILPVVCMGSSGHFSFLTPPKTCVWGIV